MDKLDALGLFLTIVDAGSLAAAARRLRRSPPVVTRGLNELEQQVGMRLIVRNTRKLALTDAGQRLATHARRVLADYEEALRDTAGEASAPRGTLRISAPLVFGRRHMAPVVMEFLDAYPDVSVDLSLADRPVDLLEDGIDVALRIAQMESSSLVARQVGVVRRILAASPAYLARAGTPAAPRDLARHEIVLFNNQANSADWRFVMPKGGEATIRVSGRFQVDRAEAAIAAAVAGRGIVATLSYQLAPHLADGSLVRLLQEFERPPIPVQLVFPSARLMAPRLRAFIDFAVPRLTTLDVLRLP